MCSRLPTRPRLLNRAGIFTLFLAANASAFEGRISATVTQGGQTSGLLYTFGTNCLRIERTDTNWPYARNIANLQSGDITLLFPHNRSFMRLKPSSESVAGVATAAPGMPMPPGSSPQPTGSPGTPRAPAVPGMAGMPTMPAPPAEKAELKATGDTTNILGFACVRYELKPRGQTLEIWATDKLFPFQPYLQNQPRRFGPRPIEDQWPGLLTERKLFPLLVTLRFDSGVERLRFEVKSITPEKITDPDGRLFQPPPDYLEIQPLPF